MKRRLIVMTLLIICIGLFVDSPRIFADDSPENAADYKAQLRQIAETPFTGTPEQYKAFSQNIGDSLIKTADQMLALHDLSAEDKRTPLLMKYWGIVRKYGFDRKELYEHLE